MPTRAVPSKNQGMIRKLERRWLRRVKPGLFDTQEDEELFQLAKDAWNWSSKFDRPRISPLVCFHKRFLCLCAGDTSRPTRILCKVCVRKKDRVSTNDTEPS